MNILSPTKTPKKLAAFFFFASSSVLMAQSWRAYEEDNAGSSDGLYIFAEPKIAIPSVILVAIFYIRIWIKEDGKNRGEGKNNDSGLADKGGWSFGEICKFLVSTFFLYHIAALGVMLVTIVFLAIF